MTADGPDAASPGAESPTAAPAPKPAPRALPSPARIEAWIGDGGELPELAHLFDKLDLKKYDLLITQVRKAELLPQHWQVISDRSIADEAGFDRLPEIERLRRHHAHGETAERRIESLRPAWRELGGKQPALWTVPDLFAAMRRIIDRELEVDLYQLLAATREVWADLPLPRGREQLDMLWTCLDFIRSKTKG